MNNIFTKKKNEENLSDNVYNDIYIPNKFRNVILKHLILNYSGNINKFSPSLLLAVQGAKGEGKTFMIKELCKFYSIDYIPISGAELCGNLEGDSVKKLIKEYEDACIRASEDRKFSCIVIDDFHKSLAAYEHSNLSRTTNSETLVGRLMNLADNPYYFNNRIPIILTGNNFTSVYSALTRHSRMDFFDWNPSDEDKYQIVFHIFRRYYPDISFQIIKELVDKYKDMYIAFFKSVAQDIFWGDCESIVYGFHKKRNFVNLDNISELVIENIDVNRNINRDQLLAFAEVRSKQNPKDFD